jgi:hypothetical protein
MKQYYPRHQTMKMPNALHFSVNVEMSYLKMFKQQIKEFCSLRSLDITLKSVKNSVTSMMVFISVTCKEEYELAKSKNALQEWLESLN